MTTCCTPALAARQKYSAKYLVRAPWKLTKCSPQSGVFSWFSGSLPSSTSAAFPPTARQNTSANGSIASGLGFCASNARAVATNNAVEPTLVVMSQVSPSLRTRRTLLRGNGRSVGACLGGDGSGPENTDLEVALVECARIERARAGEAAVVAAGQSNAGVQRASV